VITVGDKNLKNNTPEVLILLSKVGELEKKNKKHHPIQKKNINIF
jgi:hypothetical protein